MRLTGATLWAYEGRDEASLDRFFFELGAERSKLIRGELWNTARRAGNEAHVRSLKRTRSALWKNAGRSSPSSNGFGGLQPFVAVADRIVGALSAGSMAGTVQRKDADFGARP